MARNGPPAYAWDWLSRQRLLWREARERILAAGGDPAARYAPISTRADVMAMLRADYGRDEVVRAAVDGSVRALTFLDQTDRTFEELGARNPPRGMRWWWTALTGEELDHPVPAGASRSRHRQLSLDQVLEGYGD